MQEDVAVRTALPAPFLLPPCSFSRRLHAGRDHWDPVLHSDEEPISYYRVIQELNENLDLENSIVTHDAGAPRPSDLQTSLSAQALAG